MDWPDRCNHRYDCWNDLSDGVSCVLHKQNRSGAGAVYFLPEAVFVCCGCRRGLCLLL